jgi:hypothetical protein
MISQMLDVLDMDFSPDAAAMPAYLAPEGHALQQLQLQHAEWQLPDAEPPQPQQQQEAPANDQQNGGAVGEIGGDVQSTGAAAAAGDEVMADCCASLIHPATEYGASAGVAEWQGKLQADWLDAAEAQHDREHSQLPARVHGACSTAEEWPQTEACVLANG